MTSIAILARLNPKNVRFDVGAGGIPDLEQCDIAAALAGTPPLPELATKIALVKYAGQLGEVGALLRLAKTALLNLCVRHEWVVPRPAQVDGLSIYAVWEVADPHYCPVCNGSGRVRDHRRHFPECSTCSGSGRMLVTDDERRGIAGFDEGDWKNTWHRRSEILIDHLRMLEERAVTRVRCRLRQFDE